MEQTPIPSEFITSEEAALYLRRSRIVIEKWARAGVIPAYKTGKRYLFRRDELKQWVEKQATRTTGPQSQSGTARP